MKTDYSEGPPLSDRACVNHPRKKATHHLAENAGQTYCEKCALTLVTQGHKVVQLEVHEGRGSVRERRMAQIKDVMFELDRI